MVKCPECRQAMPYLGEQGGGMWSVETYQCSWCKIVAAVETSFEYPADFVYSDERSAQGKRDE